MATEVGNLVVTLSANSAPLVQGMEQAKATVQHFGNSFTTVYKLPAMASAGAAGGPLVAAAVAGAVALEAMKSAAEAAVSAIKAVASATFEAGKYAVGLGAAYQDSLVAYQTLVGDPDAGKRLLDQVQQFAAMTPFGSKTLTDSGQKLLATGMNPSNVLPMLKALGDINAALGGTDEKFQRLLMASTQVMSKGKMTAEEVTQQFGDAGVTVKMFADTLGVTEAAFFKLMEAGQVGPDVMLRTFNRLTQGGGQFSNMMGRISGNWNAQMSGLKEGFDLAMKDVGLGLIDGIGKSGAMDSLNGLLRDFKANAPQVGKWLADGFAAARPVVDSVAAGFRAIVSGVQGIGADFQKFGLIPAKEDVVWFAQTGIHFAVTAVGALADAFVAVGGALSKWVVIPFASFLQATKGQLASLLDATSLLSPGFGGILLREGASALREGGPALSAVMRDAAKFAAMAEKGTNHALAFSLAYRKNLAAGSGGPGFFGRLGEQIKNTPGAIQVKVTIPPPPPELVKLGQKIREDMLGGTTPWEQFQRTTQQLADARGLLQMTKGEYSYGLGQAFMDLEKSLDKVPTELPKALREGTAEAQQVINKAMWGGDVKSHQQRVEDALKRAQAKHDATAANTKAIEDVLRTMKLKGGGGF